MKKISIIVQIGLTILFFLRCSSPFKPDVEEFENPENEILNEVNENRIPSLAVLHR